MPPKEQLVITAEEEAIIKQKIIEQTATLQPGKDYPLRKLVKTFFALNDAIDAGGEGLDAAQEAFLTELDTYEFSMGRYSTVVAANRTQMESYDDEEEALAAKTRELKSQDVELKGKLHETVRERAFRTARDEAVRGLRARAPRETPSHRSAPRAPPGTGRGRPGRLLAGGRAG